MTRPVYGNRATAGLLSSTESPRRTGSPVSWVYSLVGVSSMRFLEEREGRISLASPYPTIDCPVCRC